ncbi:hypothetical protein OAL57_02340, partial [bacterium]|nr:hypothetical protein [bacterium]
VTEIVGATLTTGKDGSPNQAYLFDGVDDFIKCSIGAHEEVSVSLWYRSDEIHQAGDRPQVRQPYPTIFRYGGQPGSPYVTVGLGEGPWGQNLRSYLDIRPRVYDQVNTLGPLEQGVWRHAVVIKSASELTLYLDGELIDSVASTALLTGSDLYLGSSSIQTNTQNTDFLGAIDELRVYNRSLTAAEIAELSGYPTSKLTVLNLVNGSVTGGGTFNLGAEATLTATPSAGYVFVGWNGDASGNVNPLTVTMNANKSIGATFTIDTRDLDGDGLSNYQELVVLNTNPNNPDSDGDGYNDGQEQSEGTDPNDAGSFPNPNPNPIPLRIEKLNVPGLVIFAYWTGEAGTSYRLEYSADYQNWNILDSGIVSEGVEQSRFLPAPKGLVRIVEER